MAILTKAASSYTDVVGTWSGQTNAYATTGDDQYASITLSNRNGTAEIRYGFPSFTTGNIPDGSTINSVKVSAEVGLNQSIGSIIEITVENPSGTDVGTGVSTNSTSDTLIESTASTVPSLTNLRNQTVFAHILYDRANSATSETARIDYVSITVDYTAAAQNLQQTTDDSITSISDSVSRGALAATRSTSDAVGSITEAVVGSKVLNRTSADDLAAITETATRIKTANRVSADTLASITEAATRYAAWTRTSADTVGSLTESLSRDALALARAFGDTLSSITESVEAIKQGGGPYDYFADTADALASVTDVAVRTGTFIRRESRPGD